MSEQQQEQHKTMRDKLHEKLMELSTRSQGHGIAYSMSIDHIIEDIERITGILDTSWMGVPWTEYLTCEQESEVMEGRKALKELAELRSRPVPVQTEESMLDELEQLIEKKWFSVEDEDGGCPVIAIEDVEKWIAKYRQEHP